MKLKLPSFSRAVELVADVAAGAACGGILIIVLVQVTGRLLGRPLPWTEEAVRFLFIWMVFLGLAVGFRTVESARVVVFMAMGANRLALSRPHWATVAATLKPPQARR